MPKICLAIVAAVALAGCATAWPDHPCTDYLRDLYALATDAQAHRDMSAYMSEWTPDTDQWELTHYAHASHMRAFAASIDALVATSETADLHAAMLMVGDAYLLGADVLMGQIAVAGRIDDLAAAYPDTDFAWPDIQQFDPALWEATADGTQQALDLIRDLMPAAIDQCKALR